MSLTRIPQLLDETLQSLVTMRKTFVHENLRQILVALVVYEYPAWGWCMLYDGSKKGPCLLLFTNDDGLSFSIGQSRFIFICFTNIWTAIVLLSSIKMRSTVCCQQPTDNIQSSNWSYNLPNSGTEWSSRKRVSHYPQNIENPAFEDPDLLQ